MADNRYEEYLRDRSEESSTNTSMLVGGVVGAAAAAFLAPNQTRRFLQGTASATREIGTRTRSLVSSLARNERLADGVRTAGAFLKSVDHALDIGSPASRSFLYPLRGRSSNFERRFEESFRNSILENERRKTSMLGKTPTRFESKLFEAMSSKGLNDRVNFMNVQYRNLLEKVKTKYSDIAGEGLESALAQQSNDFFTNPSVSRIENFLKRYSPENAKDNNLAFNIDFKGNEELRKQFVDEMFETLDSTKSKINWNQRALRTGQGRKIGSGKYEPYEVDGQRIGGSNRLTQISLEALKRDSEASRNRFLEKVMDSANFAPLTNRAAIDHNLFDADSIRVRGADGLKDMDMGRRIKTLSKFDKEFADLVADPHVFIRKGVKPGELTPDDIVDLRSAERGIYNALSSFQQNFQVPFLRFNPLDLMHWTTYQSIREAPLVYHFQRGTIQGWLGEGAKTLRHPLAHNQDAKTGPLATNYMYAGGKVYDTLTGEMIKDNAYLASARFGMIPRAQASVLNLHQQDYRDRGLVSNLFDVGKQEVESIYQRIGSTATKFSNENWAPNVLRGMFNREKAADPEFREKAYRILYSDIHSRTSNLSDDLARYLNPHVKQAYGDIDIDLTKLRDEKEVVDALFKIQSNLPKKAAPSHIASEISRMAGEYIENPAEFTKGVRMLSDNSPYIPEPFQALDANETRLISKVDDVRRLIQQHALEQLEFKNVSVQDLIRRGVQSGELRKDALHEVSELETLTRMRSWWEDVYQGSDNTRSRALDDFFDSVVGDGEGTELGRRLGSVIEENHKWYTMGPGKEPPQYFGLVGYTAMNKAKGYTWALENFNEAVKQGTSPIKAFFESTWGVLGQPFAGRRNVDNFTTATLPFYYFAERLDNALAKVGLGLSQRNRGSMQSILFNQFGRRIVLPYMALQQLNYFDDMTGDFVSDNLADAYRNMHTDVARVEDMFGLNTLGKDVAGLLPGIDQLGKTPIGGFLRHASFGLIGDTRTAEEVDQYYESGEDPIRKGRWWAIGSNTPWEGGKIQYYQPNWYRRLKSDYQYTDTMYGSASEYWANHWMPTLTNPLAPIRHFITDPNHWEEKHAEDRPYPIQGGIPELQMIPVVGPLADNTIGRLLKPRTIHPDLEKAHREYLEEVNTYIESQYDAATQGGYMELLPAGGYRLSSGGAGAAGAAFGSGMAIGSSGGSGIPVYSEDGELISEGVGSGPVDVSMYSKAELAAINMGLTSGAGLSPARPVTSLDSLRDPNIVADLKDLSSPYGMGSMGREQLYTLTEMAGIYGFSFNTVFGIDENPGLALDESSRMMSYARRWWDLEFGGLGGDISEIGRRYNPRDPRSDYYNPLPNQMPDWLPGVDYFTDFQHGDPFCLSKDTLVDTGEGFKKAEEVQIGDMILTDKARRLPVSGVIKRPILKNEKSYRLTIAGLDSKIPLEFSEEHPILIKKLEKCSFASSSICRPDVRNFNGFCDSKNCTNKWDETPIEFVKAKDVIIGDAVAYPIPIIENPITSISYGYDWADAPRSPRYTVEGQLELNNDIGWLIGLYLAEGSTAKQNSRPMRLIFSLSSDELDVVEKLSNILESTFGKKPSISESGNALDVVLNDAVAARIMNSIIPGNLYEKRVPKDIYQASREVRLAVLLGYMLGDGTVQKNVLIGTSASRELALDLYRLAFECGLPARYAERNTRNSHEVAIHAFHLKNEDVHLLMYKADQLDFSFPRQPSVLSWSDGKYIYSIITSKEEIELDFVYGFEVDEDDTFCVIGFATHNTKIPKGEMRLPGEAYESLNELHPDAMSLAEGGRWQNYGAFDRFKILADVAPYSDQYKFYRRIVSQMNQNDMLTDEMRAEYAEVRDQVSSRRDQYNLYPYKFRYADIEKEQVTITRVLDANTFLTDEYPNNPIRLAGVHVPSDAEEVQEWLSQYIYEGARVTIGLDADPLFRVRDDTMETMRAVVYSSGNDGNPFYMTTRGQSVNSMLARANFGGVLGIGGDNPVQVRNDGSAVATAALYDETQITVGKVWENLVHNVLPNIPIVGVVADKFLQVRSPLEMYKRNEVYGKSWRPWYDPWGGWVQPMLDRWTEMNPALAAFMGYGTGWMFGRAGSKGKFYGSRIGALIGGGLATIRTFDEVLGRRVLGEENYQWIPERRRREREINQYFDILEYMKYRGLYERAKEEALREEGVDLDQILGDSEQRGEANQRTRRYFETIKKWLSIQKNLGYVDDDIIEEQLGRATDRLKLIDEDRGRVRLGAHSMQAMQYRLAYESTLYGADPHGDLTKIFRALPDKDREFFQHFINASPREREEILRIVPEDQRRFYQAKWGLEIDEKPSLSTYFMTHNLPGPNWEGWRPDVSLDSIKLKVVQNEGLELTDFGFWDDDIKRAEQEDVEGIRLAKPSLMIDPLRIEKILEGAGLNDVSVTMSVAPSNGENKVQVAMNMIKDRSREIVQGINDNLGSLI